MTRAAVTEVAALILVAAVVIFMVARLSQRVSRTLLRWAARRCFDNDELRERFAEEWLADLGDVPGELAKLAHAVGVLLLAAAPLWARSRWRRSRLARWLDRATARPRPGLAVIDTGGGAVLARAGALALTLTALLTVQPVESALRLFQTRPAPAAASGAGLGTKVPKELWKAFIGSNADGQAATIEYLPMKWGLRIDTKTVGIPVGTVCQLYVISNNGERHLASTWTTDFAENTAWYPSGIALPAAGIKSFEVTTTRTPPVFIMRPWQGDRRNVLSVLRRGPEH